MEYRDIRFTWPSGVLLMTSWLIDNGLAQENEWIMSWCLQRLKDYAYYVLWIRGWT